jgi:hypothetical protein
MVSVPSFSDLRTRYPRPYQYRREVPATPSEVSTEVERIGNILDEAEEGDMVENQDNEKPPLSGQCSPFESLVQPPYTQLEPSQFEQLASAFQQPPAISLPPPSGCPITPRSPSRVLIQHLPAAGPTIPRRTMEANQRIDQQSNNDVAVEEVIIGPGCSHFYIGPVTMNLTK